MWNRPVLRSVLPATVAGIRTGIGFVEYRDSYTFDIDETTSATFLHYVSTVSVPIEAMIGFGGDRALAYVGIGSGYAFAADGPFSETTIEGDTAFYDDFSGQRPLANSMVLLYSLTTGGVFRLGPKWVFEPRFTFLGTTANFAADFSNTVRSMGVSFGLGRRWGR